MRSHPDGGADELLARARDGDTAAFEALVAPHRRGMRAHAYRMLGSPIDADDVLQEALVNAWRGLAGFVGRASVKTWLYRIVTHCAIDAARSQRVLARELEAPSSGAEPLRIAADDVRWMLPFPGGLADVGADARYDALQSVSLAFATALQRMPPRQRAVLLLRDVVGFSAIETAEVIEDSVSAVNSLLHRARQLVPEPAKRPPLDAHARGLLDRYVRAFVSADLPALLEVIRDDVVLAMPPYYNWMSGRAAVGTFLSESSFAELWRSGMPVVPVAEADRPTVRIATADGPFALALVDVAPDGVAAVDAFLVPELIAWWDRNA